MPRVVPDQKNKYDTDELFKKLNQECDVKYTGFKDKSMEERKQRFVQDLVDGYTVITFVSTGTNLNLQFCHKGLSDDRPPDTRPTRDCVDFDRERGKVHMCASFIMNGVCVKWLGWMDTETMNGKARLLYDEDKAKVEDEIMRQVIKETQERVRMFEESQRKWQTDQQSQSSPQQLAVSQ